MPALVWEVQVAGSASDLAHLSRWFRGPPTVVWFDERDLCYLVGDDSFQQLEESSEVWVAAGEVLAVLSGVLKLIRNADETLKTGAVYLRHPDGRRDVFVSLTPAAIRLEAGEAVACVTSKDGRTVMLSSPSSPTRSLATAARTDLLVSKALRLYGSDGSSWVGLYRVHEVIEEDVGDERRMLRRAWGEPGQLKRFKHSANSVAVAGDSARHGKENSMPPSSPMSLTEAKSYLSHVLRSWLREKNAV